MTVRLWAARWSRRRVGRVVGGPLRKLLSAPILLLAAWLVVLTAVAMLVAYGLTLPPPSPEPVNVVVSLPQPPQVAARQEPAEAADGEAEAGSEAGAEEAEADPAAAPTATAEAPADVQTAGGEGAAIPLPKPKPNPETSATAEAPPEEKPETSPETLPAAAPQTPPNPQPDPAEQQQAAAPPESESASESASERASESGPESPPEVTAVDEQVVSLPVIPPAPDQLPYWERFRQPFNDADSRPRIAVVLSGLGLSDSATQAAIDGLPAAITLSFSPYARDLERWIALARARGHEVMLDLPMEPASFPNDDPGPQGLLTGLSDEENLDRLDWVLSRGSAYVGVAGSMGSRFTAERRHMAIVLKELKARGLIFLDNRTTEKSVAPALASELGLPSAINNRSIDESQASRIAIDARLAQIERIALTEGFAVAMGQPYPVTLERLAEWSTELTARGFAIAPISALVNTQTPR